MRRTQRIDHPGSEPIRTLLVKDGAPLPEELWQIISEGSDFFLVTDPPDEGFGAYANRVVVWSRRGNLSINGETLRWPADCEYVRWLFPDKR